MKTKQLLFLTVFGSFLLASSAFALDQITRPYQSVRGSGMGGLRITTGLYDENFYGNPARALANPKFRLTLLDPMFEVNSNAIDRVSDFSSEGDTLQKFGDAAGDNHHFRIQTTMPALYFPTGDKRKMAFAFGLLTSIQSDLDLRRSYRVDPHAIIDVGPAFTVARKFMEGDKLGVGMTTHLAYRLSADPSLSMADLLQNASLQAKEIGGDGAMLDFDLGATYEMPFHLKGFSFTSAVVINNLLDGRYANINFEPADTGSLPKQQPRTFGLGMSAKRDTLWKFSNFVFAFEITDIGNNNNGSMFRTFHLGTEARYGVLLPRFGLNQGYLTFGMGLDLRFFTLEYAYYAEEMTLNPGGMADHRHAIKFVLQI